jgi:hypothetical protein
MEDKFYFGANRYFVTNREPKYGVDLKDKVWETTLEEAT